MGLGGKKQSYPFVTLKGSIFSQKRPLLQWALLFYRSHSQVTACGPTREGVQSMGIDSSCRLNDKNS